jgi:hypothetical protein
MADKNATHEILSRHVRETEDGLADAMAGPVDHKKLEQARFAHRRALQAFESHASGRAYGHGITEDVGPPRKDD